MHELPKVAAHLVAHALLIGVTSITNSCETIIISLNLKHCSVACAVYLGKDLYFVKISACYVLQFVLRYIT